MTGHLTEDDVMPPEDTERVPWGESDPWDRNPLTAPWEELLDEPEDSGRSAAAPSWEPLDLTSVLDGTYKPLEPTLLVRSDGRCLLYPGRVHSLHGESESGKSFVAQLVTAGVLQRGRRVVYIDYESEATEVVGRLLQMGVDPTVILQRLDYIRPERAPTAAEERHAWGRLLVRPAELVVLDGVTEALATVGRSTIDNDEITAWMREIPRRIAQRTGAAVVLVDHVTKNSDSRGRFAIGAQAKMSSLDGAAYSVEVAEPLGRGLRGSVKLWVGKDRPGGVRPHCGEFRAADRTQLAATVVVDSTSGDIRHWVFPPDEKVGAERKPFRPTYLMEQISRALEAATEPLSSNALVKNGDVRGKKEAKQQALALLIAEGYVATATGSRNSALHTSVRPYRESTDTGPHDPGTQSPAPTAPGATGSGSPHREGDPGPSRLGHPTGSGTQSGPSGTQWALDGAA